MSLMDAEEGFLDILALGGGISAFVTKCWNRLLFLLSDFVTLTFGDGVSPVFLAETDNLLFDMPQ